MTRERRGGWLLFLGAVAVVAAAGAFAYRATRREPKATLQIFHWIPGATPVKIVGAPPFAAAAGEDVRETVDPKLLDLFRDSNVGGELRLVGELPTRTLSPSMSHAFLLLKEPKAPYTLHLFDSPCSLYIEQPAGNNATGLPSYATITLTPGKDHPSRLDFLIQSAKGGSAGSLRIWWW
jgi:hypothetical protein